MFHTLKERKAWKKETIATNEWKKIRCKKKTKHSKEERKAELQEQTRS